MTDRRRADPEGIAAAASVLAEGGLVAFPTDTVYGIACRAGDPEALDRLFAAKRRPADKAVPLLIGGMADATRLGFDAGPQASALAERFWPGGLTLVLPSDDGSGTQAFRVPNHPTARALIAAAGTLAASSANRSGEPETLDADEVQVAFADADQALLVLDGGPAPGGRASSVLDLSQSPPRLVREGAVSRAEIEGLIGPID